ncbi:ABC transporter permease [Citricoccus parietis]|uniref:ABC transporter permease n=1 Tax=Citricoccus parietis TaxID=592307 RepID=A0ABV6F8U2_9MICC
MDSDVSLARRRRTDASPPGARRGPSRSGRVTCAVVLCVLVVYAVAVPMVFPVDPNLVDYQTGAQGPSAAHPFGTDVAGRDLFLRSAAGLRVSLLAALAGAAGAVVIGTVVGASCAVIGGGVGRWCLRGVDALNAVPHLLLGIVVASFFRGSLLAIVMVVMLTHWTQTARMVRSEILSLRQQDQFRAAVSQGFTRAQLIRHVGLPRVLGHLGVASGLLVPHAVWHESTLTFLGLGMPPHLPSLGSLLQFGQESLLSGSWWSLAVPAGLLVLTTVSLAGLFRSRVSHA